jgi:hypothetical protein
MRILKLTLIALTLVFGVGISTTSAQTYRTNDRQIRTLLTRIEQRTDTFKNQVNRSVDNGRLNDTRNEGYINEVVSNFENAADSLRQNYTSNNNISNQVREVLYRGASVENMMRDYRFNVQATNTWNLLKNDLNQLARYYNVSWNWNGNNYPSYPNNGNNYPSYPQNNTLTGTYRLNISRSDDVNTIIDRSITSNNANRDRMRENLQRRLAVPEVLSIEKINNSISLASTNAPRSTFNVNGATTTETFPNGRTMSTRATFYGNRLEINTDGDRMNAFYVSFEPYNNGQSLRVTRRLNLENRNQTLTVVSVYDKTSTVAQWDVYRNGNNNTGNFPNNNYPNNNPNFPNNGTFYIPNGTRLTATLTSNLSTKNSVQGDRFVMEVTSPSQYQGARIEGTVDKVERSGRLTGRAELNLNFETIRLRNGNTYRFEGLVNRITTLNGKNINIDNEEAIRSGSQTKDTAVRGGIGAIIGAIIGGIASGGDGAAIGAAIGASAGAGSVLIQGRDDLELSNGTTFEITSSAPGNIARNW